MEKSQTLFQTFNQKPIWKNDSGTIEPEVQVF